MDAGRDAKGDAQGLHRQGVELYLSYLSQISPLPSGRQVEDRRSRGKSSPRYHLRRKNWLFCGTDSSAEDLVVIYSMMAYCKATDVDFRQWLIFFLNNVHRFDDDLKMVLTDLLPHNFKNSNTESE